MPGTRRDPFRTDGVWLKTALHTHTSASDGQLTPEAHVQQHEWAGFDVCAITDHWTLTSVPSTEHLLVITGAELAVDPLAEGRYSEILAIGIDAIPEDPGGDRAHWERIDNYLFKTFPDYATAAAFIEGQGGASFIAHPYWSGLPPETVLYPGHNYSERKTSTIGDEARTNPYMRFARMEDFLTMMGY